MSSPDSDDKLELPFSLEDDLAHLQQLREVISEVMQEEQAQQGPGQTLKGFVEDLPMLSPQEIYDEVGRLGYVGQRRARRSLSLMAHRHVRRLRYLFLEGIPAEELPPKSNQLLIGPTGCGKTFLIELLFKHIFKLPTVMVDVTNFSETGYVGNDVSSILTRLLFEVDGVVPIAEIGVVCIDEFDKLASNQNNAVFAGAGTTKDISGLGVQRELLKLLENTTLTVPTEFSHSSYQQHALMSTANIPFIACGAFSGFKQLAQLGLTGPDIGFLNQTRSKVSDDIAVSFTQEDVDQTRLFQQYGFLPELVARFERVVPFRALDKETLSLILRENLIVRYQREFALAGIELNIENSLVDSLVQQALKRETGARGLRSALSRLLEDVAFDVYSEQEVQRVGLGVEKDQLVLHKD